MIAVGARRLHDVNRSGWWQRLALGYQGDQPIEPNRDDRSGGASKQDGGKNRAVFGASCPPLEIRILRKAGFDRRDRHFERPCLCPVFRESGRVTSFLHRAADASEVPSVLGEGLKISDDAAGVLRCMWQECAGERRFRHRGRLLSNIKSDDLSGSPSSDIIARGLTALVRAKEATICGSV